MNGLSSASRTDLATDVRHIMASTSENITCGGFVFFNNFDSANLAKVEQVRIPETSDKGNEII